MRNIFDKYRLLGWLGLVLVIGFSITSIASYLVSRSSIRRIAEQHAAEAIGPAQQILMLNIVIGIAVTLLALFIARCALKDFERSLEQSAAIDPLTGLLNRQAFKVIFQQSMLDIERSGHPLSAIRFDIDHFTRVNDAHGHIGGDQVLHVIGQLARQTVRENDIIARWGGKEFLILLRHCDLETAFKLAEKLRKTISVHDFGFGTPDKPITTSIGVAQFVVAESQVSFYTRADKALHHAKSQGGNKTVVSVADGQNKNANGELV